MENFDFKKYLAEGKLQEEQQAKSRLDTAGYIEPEEIEATLSTIYHIISGNRRDYLNISDEVLDCLKQFA
jgi:hypothetical protein